tara:strand:+ start:202 stop:594 length:393 start_codon:yes stop_codon:yes gene_type:complete
VEKIKSKRKPRKCAKCGSAKIASIVYGEYFGSDKLNKDLEDGKIVLGGCCITIDEFGNADPLWECIVCGTKIYKEASKNEKDRDKEYNELLDRAKSNLKDALKITDAKDTVQGLTDIVYNIENMKRERVK